MALVMLVVVLVEVALRLGEEGMKSVLVLRQQMGSIQFAVVE